MSEKPKQMIHTDAVGTTGGKATVSTTPSYGCTCHVPQGQWSCPLHPSGGTPPNQPSRSIQRRIAVQKGEPEAAPTPAPMFTAEDYDHEAAAARYVALFGTPYSQSLKEWEAGMWKQAAATERAYQRLREATTALIDTEHEGCVGYVELDALKVALEQDHD